MKEDSNTKTIIMKRLIMLQRMSPKMNFLIGFLSIFSSSFESDSLSLFIGSDDPIKSYWDTVGDNMWTSFGKYSKQN